MSSGPSLERTAFGVLAWTKGTRQRVHLYEGERDGAKPPAVLLGAPIAVDSRQCEKERGREKRRSDRTKHFERDTTTSDCSQRRDAGGRTPVDHLSLPTDRDRGSPSIVSRRVRRGRVATASDQVPRRHLPLKTDGARRLRHCTWFGDASSCRMRTTHRIQDDDAKVSEARADRLPRMDLSSPPLQSPESAIRLPRIHAVRLVTSW